MRQASVILIVDDEAFGRKALQAALAGQGYEFVLAASGPEALAQAAETLPDLILLDVMMPGMDGFETLRRLRADPRLAEMPIILVTALDDRDSRLIGFEAGADDFLSKPIDRAEVRARTRTITRLNRYRRIVEERSRFQQLFELSPDGILIVTLDGTIQQANPSAARLLDEHVGLLSDRSLFDFFMPTQRPELANCLLAYREGARLTRRMELTLKRPEGPLAWVELLTGPFALDEVPAVQVILRDITQRRLAEERIRQQAELLDLAPDAIIVEDASGRIGYWNCGAEQTYGWKRDEVLGRTLEQFLPDASLAPAEVGFTRGEIRRHKKDRSEIVVQARETLLKDDAGQARSRLMVHTDVTEQKRLEKKFYQTQRMESLGALAGGIAHDLNNVLTPLAMGIGALGKHVPADALDHHLLATMEACVERGAGLVQQILTFVRGQQGTRKSLELGPLLREVGKLVGASVPNSTTIDVDVAKDLWPVLGDVTQLYQVVMNLVVNARDAMPQGGRLTLHAVNAPGAGPDAKDGVDLRVRDTGTGIAPELRERIFEPFFTTKEPGQGTGLGLATVADIVRAHGGTIAVTSEPGQGSEFHVWLPSDLRRPKSMSTERTELPAGNGELVLVIDDERSVRELARAILETYGYRTLVAPDAGNALRLSKEHGTQINLAVIDCMLPGGDGFELCHSLQQLHPSLKILMMSAGTPEPEALKAVGVSAEEFVPKPFTALRLLSAVKRMAMV